MYDHILVPIDLDQKADHTKAMRTAVRIAKDYRATLHILNVVSPLGAFASTFFPEGFHKQAMEAARKQLHAFTKNQDLEGVPVQHVVAGGSIYDQIIEIATAVSADLIIMASHRPEFQDYLLGPNAARVVRHATCSVMVVRD